MPKTPRVRKPVHPFPAQEDDPNVEVVQVGKRTITVRVMTLPMAMKEQRIRGTAIEVLVAKAREAGAEAPDLDELVVLQHFYPPLAACSSGDVPTAEEFLLMPVLETNAWYECVDRLNPGLLPTAQVDAKVAKEQLEKKDQKPTSST